MNLNDVVRLKGCTLRGRTLETSSGCSALDTLLGGGGVPVSALCIVDELTSRTYSASIARYFVAEGLHAGHDILIVDPVDGDKLWQEIPARIVTEPATSSADNGNDEISPRRRLEYSISICSKAKSELVDW
ncbi:hypothetical protein KIN20_016446 [Parelaphostrongylus tenuis]|uniref:Elongator complex protein 4 n=1 Tax=Parelaphostrongylus tenuis TaxID=148309 RepID=A0AAD5MZT5_PARTN|nr:hypothetical protein KIN20_016446 [Parelaphostrongylus tenuis]